MLEAESPTRLADIEQAAKRIAPFAVVTPLLESQALNERVGGRVLIKAEMLQRTGSFKFRGATNRMALMRPDELERGVVAYSSGNHGQAVALAGRIFGTTAVIVMPSDAPRMKVERTRQLGGEIVMYDRLSEDRAAIGNQIARERGLILVPPYEDPHIIAGQGTLGREVALQADKLDARLDAFLVCCSGGGLTAGCALALQALSPATRVIAVEPEGFDDTARSLAAGHPVRNEPGKRSICDAILAEQPGEMTFSINKRLLAGALDVTDHEALQAVRFAHEQLKIVVEPGGAVALAAVLSGKFDASGKTIGVVCSGGNVDSTVFRQALDA
jgi:threonine dehydratase